MNAVGIDVSKGKSMVAIMRPFGEIVSSPFEIKHTTSDINSLVELINSVEGESRIVMEHTGRYYEVLAHQLFGTDEKHHPCHKEHSQRYCGILPEVLGTCSYQ